MGELFGPLGEEGGSKLALADEFGETSWADLDRRVNCLIDALRGVGLAPGDTIAIFSGNRREYFEAMAAGTQGAWRYVPINWHWVADEVAYVLENSDTKVLIVDAL